MLSERNPVWIGVIVAALLVVLTVAALGLKRETFVGGYRITVEFSDANGLRAGDVVTVAGVRAGRVADLRIAGGLVEAVLIIEGAELPRATRAAIAPQTLIGKRAIELTTGGDFAQLLGDGDRIDLSATRVGIDVPTFGDVAQELLSQVDAQALNTFVVALTDITRGQRDELAQLIDGGSRLTGVVNDSETQIRALLRELRAFSATLAARDDELVNILDDFSVVLTDLNARRDDLVRLFAQTNATSATAADVVAENRVQLDAILDEVTADLDIINAHQLDLAEALAYAPDAVGGFASIAFAGQVNVSWAHVFVTGLGPAGVDVLLGCGGLVDRQLDDLLGPDPRSCADQANNTFPDDVGGTEGPGRPTDPNAGPQPAPPARISLGAWTAGLAGLS